MTEQDAQFDRPFVLLIQDACPECERLKKMLAGPLKGQFDERITFVHRSTQTQLFEEIAQKHNLRTTPALLNVNNGEILLRTGIGEVKAFLSQV